MERRDPAHPAHLARGLRRSGNARSCRRRRGGRAARARPPAGGGARGPPASWVATPEPEEGPLGWRPSGPFWTRGSSALARLSLGQAAKSSGSQGEPPGVPTRLFSQRSSQYRVLPWFPFFAISNFPPSGLEPCVLGSWSAPVSTPAQPKGEGMALVAGVAPSRKGLTPRGSPRCKGAAAGVFGGRC